MGSEIIIALLCAVSATWAADSSSDPATPLIFDGTASSTGSGWSAPKDGTKLSIAADGETPGRAHLVLTGTTEAWSMCFGWNWTGWSPPGSDLTACAWLALRMKIAQGSPVDLDVYLVDAGGNAGPPVGLQKSGIISMIDLSSGYKDILLPVEKLCNGINRKGIWERSNSRSIQPRRRIARPSTSKASGSANEHAPRYRCASDRMFARSTMAADPGRSATLR